MCIHESQSLLLVVPAASAPLYEGEPVFELSLGEWMTSLVTWVRGYISETGKVYVHWKHPFTCSTGSCCHGRRLNNKVVFSHCLLDCVGI